MKGRWQHVVCPFVFLAGRLRRTSFCLDSFWCCFSVDFLFRPFFASCWCQSIVGCDRFLQKSRCVVGFLPSLLAILGIWRIACVLSQQRFVLDSSLAKEFEMTTAVGELTGRLKKMDGDVVVLCNLYSVVDLRDCIGGYCGSGDALDGMTTVAGRNGFSSF